MRLKRVIMLFAVLAVFSGYSQYRKKRSDPVYFLRERYIRHVQAFEHGYFSFSRYKNFCLYCLRIVKLTAKPYRERIILFAYSVLVSAFVSLSAAHLPSKHVRRRKLMHACAYPRIKHCRRTNSGNAERKRTRRLLLFPMGKTFYLLAL